MTKDDRAYISFTDFSLALRKHAYKIYVMTGVGT